MTDEDFVIQEFEVQKKRGKNSPKFESGMKATVSEVHKATKGKKLVNGREHKSLLLYPEVIERVERIIEQERLQKMDAWEWLINQGIMRYEQGARPEKVAAPVTHRVKK